MGPVTRSRDRAFGSEPYRPDDGVTLRGPFLTRRRAAVLVGEPTEAIRWRRDLLRISSRIQVEEAYPAFQFDDGGLRRDVAFVVLLLKRRVTDAEACDWMLRTHPLLGHVTPSGWLGSGGAIKPVIEAFPEPSRPIPGHDRHLDVASLRAQWLRLNGDTAPGWHTPWEETSRRETVAVG